MVALNKKALWIVVLIIVSLVVFTVTTQAQTGVPVGPTTCYVWGADGIRHQVPCSSTGSTSGSEKADKPGGLIGGPLNKLLCMIPGAGGCPKKTDKRKEAAYDLNQKGNEAYSKGDWATAVEYYERALDKSPDDSVIQQNLSNARAQLAIQIAKEKDATATAQNDLGVEAYKKGDWATAEAYFLRALEYSPNDSVIRRNLSNARDEIAALEARERTAKEKAEREEAERQAQNKAAAVDMQRSLQDVVQSMKAAPISSGLAIRGGGAGSSNALEQLKGVAGTGNKAKDEPNPDKKADLAMKGFDKEGEKGVLPLVKIPEGIALESPPEFPTKYGDNPDIMKYQKDWQAGKTARDVAEKKLQEITELKAKPGADMGVLQTKEVDALFELNKAKQTQMAAAANTKKTVRMLEFNEERLPDGSNPAPKQPPIPKPDDPPAIQKPF